MLSAGAIFSQGYTAPIRMGTNADAPIKLGVNGFGRIGRQVVRIAMDRESMVLKHINSPMTPDYMKYLLEHDTVHGRFSGTCEIKGDGLVVNGMPVSLSATRDPTEIPWAATGVDYVCESTGAFTTTEACMKDIEGCPTASSTSRSSMHSRASLASPISCIESSSLAVLVAAPVLDSGVPP